MRKKLSNAQRARDNLRRRKLRAYRKRQREYTENLSNYADYVWINAYVRAPISPTKSKREKSIDAIIADYGLRL